MSDESEERGERSARAKTTLRRAEEGLGALAKGTSWARRVVESWSRRGGREVCAEGVGRAAKGGVGNLTRCETKFVTKSESGVCCSVCERRRRESELLRAAHDDCAGGGD